VKGQFVKSRCRTFRITLASGDALYTFEFENAHRLVPFLSVGENLENRQIDGVVTVALAYYAFGRGKKVVNVTELRKRRKPGRR